MSTASRPHYQQVVDEIAWSQFEQRARLDEPIKKFVFATREYGFYPVLMADKDWRLLNHDRVIYIDFCGHSNYIAWGLHDGEKPHPDPVNAGMHHIKLAGGHGHVTNQIAELKRYMSK